MKKHLWDLGFYAIMFGLAYYNTAHEVDLIMTALIAVLIIGAVQIFSTFLAIAWYGLVVFWNATVNYSKNRKEYKEDEI